MIAENSRVFKFLYGPTVFRQTTVEALAALYRENMLALIAACPTVIH